MENIKAVEEDIYVRYLSEEDNKVEHEREEDSEENLLYIEILLDGGIQHIGYFSTIEEINIALTDLVAQIKVGGSSKGFVATYLGDSGFVAFPYTKILSISSPLYEGVEAHEDTKAIKK